jgi:hypothetical protein
MQNTHSQVAPESVPLRAVEPNFQPTPAPVPDFQSACGSLPQIAENGEPSYVRRPGKEPAGASAPVGAVGNQSRQPQSTEVTNLFWGNVKLEAKIEIPEYRGELDGEKLDAWLDKLESYFSLYGFNDLQRLTFVRVKMESHALIWWNAYVQSRGFQNLAWDGFKTLVRKQFYPVGYREARWRKWLFLKQYSEHTVQEYTTEFKRCALLLGVPMEDPDVFTKYMAGLNDQVRGYLKMYPILDIDDACEKGTTVEQTLFPKKYSKDRKMA